MTNLAEELIERRSGPFKPDAFSSGYRDALRDLIEEKQKKGTITAKPAAKTADSGKVVDLMEALRRSLDDEKKKNKKKKPRRSGRSKAA